MIQKLHIQNFKSHVNTEFDFSNLNIFTGLNGMGKSSVIQSLLLLRQTYQKNILDKGLILNDNLCKLGTAKDVLCQTASENSIRFLHIYNNKQFDWKFEIIENKLWDTFIPLKNKSIPEKYNLTDYNLFNNNFQYISAFRNGPLHDYEKDTSAVEIFNQISKNEGRCEMIAHFLDYHRKEAVSDITLKKNQDDEFSDLIIQVQNWLSEISPDINIHVRGQETTFKITYSYNRGEGKTPTQEFNAYNVGFGISYALPIIVAALHSPKDSIIIIENPESHLHPEGQAKLMELICKAAKTGVQFFIETHSDHIVNGMLVAVKRKIIEPSEVGLYYFNREKSSHETKETFLQVVTGGKIKRPPKGFFDRMDKDLDILMDMNNE